MRPCRSYAVGSHGPVVALVSEHLGEQGAHHRALRCPRWRRGDRPVFPDAAAPQPGDAIEPRLLLHPLLENAPQPARGNVIAARGAITRETPFTPPCGVGRPPAQSAQGMMARSPWATPPRTRMQHALVERRQAHCDRGLHHAVAACGDPPRPPLPVGFGHVYPLDRLRSVVARQQRVVTLVHAPRPSRCPLSDVACGDASDARRVAPVVGEHGLQARASPSRITHPSIEPRVPARGLSQPLWRQRRWDCQAMCRLHGHPLRRWSGGRTGALRPGSAVTVALAGRDSRDDDGASAPLDPAHLKRGQPSASGWGRNRPGPTFMWCAASRRV
jgi:hypothetical protein